jgi:hypothetical protein
MDVTPSEMVIEVKASQ